MLIKNSVRLTIFYNLLKIRFNKKPYKNQKNINCSKYLFHPKNELFQFYTNIALFNKIINFILQTNSKSKKLQKPAH